VVIVDDHEVFRESARGLLEADGFDVVGLAPDAERALPEIQRLRPDLVLLDIQLPGLDGFAAAQLISELVPAPQVVLISSRDRSAYHTRLEHAPVRGFLSKHELSGDAIFSLLG
jgi:DNA-binding NarL/FixJ family response regulator